MAKSKGFKDISLSFEPHPVTKDIPILANERAIVRSVRNLVETIPSERFFDSNLGTPIREMLFDNFSRLLSNFVIFLATVLSFGSGNTRIFNFLDIFG